MSRSKWYKKEVTEIVQDIQCDSCDLLMGAITKWGQHFLQNKQEYKGSVNNIDANYGINDVCEFELCEECFNKVDINKLVKETFKKKEQ